VLVALGAGLTLTPALTAIWGPKIAFSVDSAGDSTGFFRRLAQLVQRRPMVTAVLTSAVLASMALPFLGARFSSGDYRVLPTSVESRRATDTMVRAFPSMSTEPIEVVMPHAPTSARLVQYVQYLRGVPGVRVVTTQGVGSAPVALVEVVPKGAAQGPVARRVVNEIRSHRPPFTLLVTGTAASLVDFESQVTNRLPYAVAWIALMTMLLLFLMTGSVLVPIKAVVMNVLSLGATFGALTWVFQEGHLSGLLHFDGTGTIEVWVPILVFVFGFGLSMDYEVFLLSRIKESFEGSGDSDHAVADGLQRSGRIITSAAVLVGIVFLGFAAGDNLGIKEMGLALAVAVLVDATLVRCLLVPATMTLLGDLNWWAPAALRRVYERVGLHESPVLPTTVAEDKPREAITLEV
jgi:RND superfamily putative drug exporter